MSIRWIFAVFMAALACGCTSLQIYPRDGDLISGTEAPVPVTIQLTWPSGGLGMGPIVEREVVVATVPRSPDRSAGGARIDPALVIVDLYGRHAHVWALPKNQNRPSRVRIRGDQRYGPAGVGRGNLEEGDQVDHLGQPHGH